MARTSVAEKRRDEVAGVRLTHADRVYYPEQHITKELLARFYERIADWILPHVVNRPLSVVRCPQGRQAKCFFQKHVTESLGAPIRGLSIREKEQSATYIVIDDLPGLITLVQLGALELHPWGARADDVDRPDRLIFDLDPGPGVDWEAVVAAAHRVRERLAELGLRSFAKTTGGKGLHVVVPLARKVAWDVLRDFSRAVALSLVRESSGEYLATMSKARRNGRIFIDYLRNGRGATCVAAYSTRAHPGAPVSTPVDWEELDALRGSAAFTVENLPLRLIRRRRDPWRDFFAQRQALTAPLIKKAGRLH
jgi:bifunctional non-homologous end joining protein LigD